MNNHDIVKLLTDRKVEIDPTDERDPLEIALSLGFLGLEFIANEFTGTFDHEDIKRMRKEGIVIETIGFGQAVYEAVLTDEDEV